MGRLPFDDDLFFLRRSEVIRKKTELEEHGCCMASQLLMRVLIIDAVNVEKEDEGEERR